MTRQRFRFAVGLLAYVRFRVFLVLLAGILSCAVARPIASQQAPPPAPPPPPGGPTAPKLDSVKVLEHLETARHDLENMKAGGQDVDVLLKAAHRALDAASEKVKVKNYFGADRRIAAADAFRRAAEHPMHVTEGPRGPVPQAPEIADHLQRVYFRLQQAEYFAGASGDPDAKALPPVARRFYDEARKAYDSGNWFTADEYAKSADDTIHGLENLAQAAAPAPPPPPRLP
jgi:hypothetical protein